MKLAWIGLGTTGGAMAAHVVRAGHDVAVWNRSAVRVAPLADGPGDEDLSTLARLQRVAR